MKPKERNAAKTKSSILQAARRLFADRGISDVSIRDIASAAGVSHGLVQQYFGTRARMVEGIIESEIADFGNLTPPVEEGRQDCPLENIRSMLANGDNRFRDFARLITRAELEGIEPGKMLDPSVPTPAMQMAASIRELKTTATASCGELDPRLVSAYINASLFAFATMAPWLMASVGLKPEDYEARRHEIADITVRLIALAAGIGEPSGKPDQIETAPHPPTEPRGG